jgi:hypothetical protein
MWSGKVDDTPKVLKWKDSCPLGDLQELFDKYYFIQPRNPRFKKMLLIKLDLH